MLSSVEDGVLGVAEAINVGAVVLEKQNDSSGSDAKIHDFAKRTG